jgi:hypothetical protein
MAFTLYHCFVMWVAMGFGAYGMNMGLNPEPRMLHDTSRRRMLILAGGFMLLTGLVGFISTFLRPH